MSGVDLVLIHGFWSGPATWNTLSRRISSDDALSDVRIHRFQYESPKLRIPFSTTRIPDYNDIAQSFDTYLSAETDRSATAIVTHSQGGLILQRFLAWMLNEGRGRYLAHIKKIVMLACPHDGSDYLRSIRTMARFGRHPQARDLTTLNTDVSDARRTVVHQVVNASGISERTCPIPIHVYAGRTDRVVGRVSAQGDFPRASAKSDDLE
jgi:pimeloyl-ACP methyl ester carboxylesterase